MGALRRISRQSSEGGEEGKRVEAARNIPWGVGDAKLIYSASPINGMAP